MCDWLGVKVEWSHDGLPLDHCGVCVCLCASVFVCACLCPHTRPRASPLIDGLIKPPSLLHPRVFALVQMFLCACLLVCICVCVSGVTVCVCVWVLCVHSTVTKWE